MPPPITITSLTSPPRPDHARLRSAIRDGVAKAPLREFSLIQRAFGLGNARPKRLSCCPMDRTTANALAGLFLALASIPTSLAQDATPLPPITPDTAAVARERADAMREEAERRFQKEKAECSTRMIAIGCLSAAQERRSEAGREADAIRAESFRVEREARKSEFAEKEARRAVEARQREEREAQRAAKYREDEAKRAQERERRSEDAAAELESRRGKAGAGREDQLRALEERQREQARRAEAAKDNARKRAERLRQHDLKVREIEQRKRDYEYKLKARQAEKAAEEARRAAAEAKK